MFKIQLKTGVFFMISQLMTNSGSLIIKNWLNFKKAYLLKVINLLLDFIEVKEN